MSWISCRLGSIRVPRVSSTSCALLEHPWCIGAMKFASFPLGLAKPLLRRAYTRDAYVPLLCRGISWACAGRMPAPRCAQISVDAQNHLSAHTRNAEHGPRNAERRTPNAERETTRGRLTYLASPMFSRLPMRENRLRRTARTGMWSRRVPACSD
jgi:hypothetical protein